MQPSRTEDAAEKLWKSWWVEQKLSIPEDMPVFMHIHTQAQRALVPWDKLKLTAFVERKDNHFSAYKLFRDGEDMLAWWMSWSMTDERRVIHAITRILEADPIGLHSLFPQAALPRVREEMGRFGVSKSHRAKRIDGPPRGIMGGEIVFYEMNWEYRRFSLDYAKLQIEWQVFGQERLKRCFTGAQSKLGATGLWDIGYAIDADPKDLGAWMIQGAPFVRDDIAYKDPDKLRFHPKASQAFRDGISLIRLAQYEQFSPCPRYWTHSEHFSFVSWSKQITQAR